MELYYTVVEFKNYGQYEMPVLARDIYCAVEDCIRSTKGIIDGNDIFKGWNAYLVSDLKKGIVKSLRECELTGKVK